MTNNAPHRSTNVHDHATPTNPETTRNPEKSARSRGFIPRRTLCFIVRKQEGNKREHPSQPPNAPPPWVRDVGSSSAPEAELRLKIVPGSTREGVAPALGDRLKLRVSAPPEGGRANERVLAMLAERLGTPSNAVQLVAGRATPMKTVRVRGLRAAEVAERLG